MRTLLAILSAGLLWLAAAPASAYVYWSDYGSLFSGGGTTLVRANQDASGLRSP